MLPDIPTFKEVGLEPVNRPAYYGIYGPKGLPKEVVDKVHDAVKKTARRPGGEAAHRGDRLDHHRQHAGAVEAQIAAEFEVYKKVVAAQKLKLEVNSQPASNASIDRFVDGLWLDDGLAPTRSRATGAT